MKKVNSLKSISKHGRRVWSPITSPADTSILRSNSTSALPDIVEAAEVERLQSICVNKQASAGNHAGTSAAPQITSSTAVPTYDTLPEHHEAHVGPYGLEMPPNFSFVVTVIEVSVTENDAAATRPDKDKPRVVHKILACT
jgi:hypothetical protein